MRLLFIFFLFTSLFACDTSSNVKAYKDYTKAKQLYIKAVLSGSKYKKISSLREIVKCGKFLGFNVKRYQTRLNQLTNHSPLKIESSYIKLLSLNPIKIKLSKKMKVKFFTLYKNKTYYKIFDIYNAKVNKLIVKRLAFDRFLKIAQNDKNKVRVVIYSKHKFKVKYWISDILKIVFLDTKKTYVNHSQPNHTKVYHKINHNKIIVIDPGHGGKDPGAIGQYRIYEKNVVLPLSKYLAYELKKRGYKVYLTRNTDKFITLKNRTKFANKKHADLFISLHCNIAPKHPRVYGIETYFLSPARSSRAKRVAKIENSAIGNLRSTTQNIVLNFLNKNRIIDSTKLAIDIQKSLIYNLKKHYKYIKDSGVRPAPFWVLVGTQMPAILIETGFISNKREAKRLNSKYYQRRFAKSIADGIDNYFRKNP